MTSDQRIPELVRALIEHDAANFYERFPDLLCCFYLVVSIATGD